jgi:hypothetical protein
VDQRQWVSSSHGSNALDAAPDPAGAGGIVMNLLSKIEPQPPNGIKYMLGGAA